MNTNIEVNKALHLALGKCVHEWVGGKPPALFICTKCGEEGYTYSNAPAIPNYAGSLDAVAEAERWMFTSDETGELANRYVTALSKEVGIDTTRWEQNGFEGWKRVVFARVDAYCLATASALQRATACLKALGVEG